MAKRRMAARRLGALTAVAAIALLVAATGSPADPPQLDAKFSANLTFSMWTGDGAPLGSPSPPGRTIPAGYYAVNVDDGAEIGYMTFLLQGPGVSLRTTNDEGASALMTYFVTLQPGSTYSFSDRVNPKLPPLFFSTSGSVGSTQAGSTPTSSSPGSGATQPNTVSPVGIATTADGSSKNGFIVQEAGLSAKSVGGVSFVGKRSTTVRFSIGQWLYYATVLGRKTYFLVTR